MTQYEKAAATRRAHDAAIREKRRAEAERKAAVVDTMEARLREGVTCIG